MTWQHSFGVGSYICKHMNSITAPFMAHSPWKMSAAPLRLDSLPLLTLSILFKSYCATKTSGKNGTHILIYLINSTVLLFVFAQPPETMTGAYFGGILWTCVFNMTLEQSLRTLSKAEKNCFMLLYKEADYVKLCRWLKTSPFIPQTPSLKFHTCALMLAAKTEGEQRTPRGVIFILEHECLSQGVT